MTVLFILGITGVGHHYLHSPKLLHPHPYSPKQQTDPSIQQLGMFSHSMIKRTVYN